MERLIDANELYVDARFGENEEPYISLYQINNAPTVDAEPVRHGWWTNISISANGIESSAECALCGAIVHNSFSSNINYCPNCGAMMTLD